MVLDC
ncbi:hypothetical protein MTR67_023770 [Solanum verrucosum]